MEINSLTQHNHLMKYNMHDSCIPHYHLTFSDIMALTSRDSSKVTYPVTTKGIAALD